MPGYANATGIWEFDQNLPQVINHQNIISHILILSRRGFQMLLIKAEKKLRGKMLLIQVKFLCKLGINFSNSHMSIV